MDSNNIRNFTIIAHIDHGKSTLADRMLEITSTVEKRKMKEQVLDSMELERERGITIKMTPVRMHWMSSRGSMRIKTDSRGLLYEDLTYKIRGAVFKVYNTLGPGHKEIVYQNSLELELANANLTFEREKRIDVVYEDKKVGLYQPDFVVEGKVIIELKAIPFLGEPIKKQVRYYLRGSDYKLALLVNFGSNKLEIERVIFDIIRDNPPSNQQKSAGSEFILNLIDTPGHIDFSYEVSRALKAVEGSILLVDATQGVQAQTLTTLEMARNLNLVIIPVVSKIDSPLARTEEVKEEIALLLKCDKNDILEVSGKTGEGVEALLQTIVERIPSPKMIDEVLIGENPPSNPQKSAMSFNSIRDNPPSNPQKSAMSFRALIFDFEYSNHRGVIIYVRVISGTVKKGDNLIFRAANKKFAALEIGIFTPMEKPKETLSTGEIGYIVTGIKEPGIVSVGDTVSSPDDNLSPIKGYMLPQPVVWSSVYPESQDDFELLRQSLDKLKLSDSSLSFEEESSGILGRGMKCGFLGMLHLEIITERLRREFGLSIIISSPTIKYQIQLKGGKTKEIYTPSAFPPEHQIEKVFEPWTEVNLITPSRYVGRLMTLIFEHEGMLKDSENFRDDRMNLKIDLPLRELMRGFFDKVKSQTSGFASLSYILTSMREADVLKLEILVAEEIAPAFTKIVSRKNLEQEAKTSVEKLYEILPKQMFVVKIQALAVGRIIASRTLSALKKDVTQHMYGGDITRKMKLREKQKKGKQKMRERGRVNIPQDVYLKMLKGDQ